MTDHMVSNGYWKRMSDVSQPTHVILFDDVRDETLVYPVTTVATTVVERSHAYNMSHVCMTAVGMLLTLIVLHVGIL